MGPKELLSIMEDLQSTTQGKRMAEMLANTAASSGGSFLSPTGRFFHGGTAADPAFMQMLGAAGPSAQTVAGMPAGEAYLPDFVNGKKVLFSTAESCKFLVDNAELQATVP